ncbi:hypothetical protein SASPL_112629 [Salvia splendens]|uniref:AMP-dependent synthetase/ligase domain-containing protein n=1 Tax=Salvia splendens TaxID=180675 RepID=A0A8X8Y9F1_SALSN|nr:hypothetical protein SASPL_112629 [Salvia splendens]
MIASSFSAPMSCNLMLASSYSQFNQHRLISCRFFFDRGGRFVSRSQRVYCGSEISFFDQGLISASFSYPYDDLLINAHSKLINDVQIRKFAPVLECEIASGNGILQSNEWKTVPDIWRTCAEKFGDRVALVDHYHNPPTNMTYNQKNGWIDGKGTLLVQKKNFSLFFLEFAIPEAMPQIGPDPARSSPAVSLTVISPFSLSAGILSLSSSSSSVNQSSSKIWDRCKSMRKVLDVLPLLCCKQVNMISLEQEILNFCEGLRVIGLKAEEKLALFADNSCRWLVSDQGIMATGAVNVVRGTRSSVEELLQIYNHSDRSGGGDRLRQDLRMLKDVFRCAGSFEQTRDGIKVVLNSGLLFVNCSVALVVDNPELYKRISEAFCFRATVRFIILLWGEKTNITSEAAPEVPIYTYQEIIDMGCQSHEALRHSGDARTKFTYETIRSDDIATLIYTSGTTGNPKGVMLTHKNLLHQVGSFWDILPAVPGDRFLSMLPPWHAYERAAEYFIFTLGIEQVYTTVKNLKDDLYRYQPHFVISVPLVYETLYSAIQKQIRTSSVVRKVVALLFLKISFTYMEARRIYEASNADILVFHFPTIPAQKRVLLLDKGKCLTRNLEQPSHVSAVFDWLWARIIALILWPLHTLAKKIVYSKIHSAIGISKAGISGGGSLPPHVDRFFEAIGVTVQNGYGLTEASPVVAARRPNCNVATGVEDVPFIYRGLSLVIGWICPPHSIGRSRRSSGVIVLEGRAKDTIVLLTGENVEPAEIEEAAMRSNLIQQIVVIGQDRRRLGAIIVPNKEETLSQAKKLAIVEADAVELSKMQQINLLHEELRKWTLDCSFQVGPILVVDDPFTIDSGLMTPTMKIRRDRVVSLYQEQIDNLYKGIA